LISFFSQRVAAAVVFLSVVLCDDISPSITLLANHYGFLKYAAQCLDDMNNNVNDNTNAQTSMVAAIASVNEALDKYEEVFYKTMNLPISSSYTVNHHYQISLLQKATMACYKDTFIDDNDTSSSLLHDMNSTSDKSRRLLSSGFCCFGFLRFSIFTFKSFEISANKSLLSEHIITALDLFILTVSKLCVAHSCLFNDNEVKKHIMQTIPAIMKYVKGNSGLFQHIYSTILSHCCDASSNNAKGFIARILLCGCFLKSSDRHKVSLVRNLWSLVVRVSTEGESGKIGSNLLSLVCSSLSSTIRCILLVAKSDVIGILLGNIIGELKKDNNSSVSPYVLEKVMMQIPWEQLRNTKGQDVKALIDQVLKVLSHRIVEPRSFDKCSGYYLSVLVGLAKVNNAERDINSILMPKFILIGKYIAGFTISDSISAIDSSMRYERLVLTMYTLSFAHHLIENLTTEHCLEMTKLSSALSSACLLLASNTAISTKKRKLDVVNVEEKERDVYDDIQYFCYCACQMATKSIKYHLMKNHRDHRDNQHFGIEHLKNTFQSLFKVSELVPSSCSWSIVNALVTCIFDMGKSLNNHTKALNQFRDSVPRQVIIALKAKSSKQSVSLERQKTIEIDEYSQKVTLLKLWRILS
jgi:hypothetical protein